MTIADYVSVNTTMIVAVDVTVLHVHAEPRFKPV